MGECKGNWKLPLCSLKFQGASGLLVLKWQRGREFNIFIVPWTSKVGRSMAPANQQLLLCTLHGLGKGVREQQNSTAWYRGSYTEYI